MSVSDADKVNYKNIRSDVYHTLVYLIMKSNKGSEVDLFVDHRESGGDLMNQYYISCEGCSGDIVKSKLKLTYHPGGWMRRGNKHISADIWINVGHYRGAVTWNTETYVHAVLPIYADREVGLKIIPGLLIEGAGRNDTAAVIAKAAIDEELLKNGAESIESVNILIHAMTHFFVIMSALQSNTGWNHSVQESWMKTFIESSIAGKEIVRTYELKVRSSLFSWNDRNFKITADPLTEELTINGEVKKLSELKAFIDVSLAYKHPSSLVFRAMPSFHQQYLDIDRRVDSLRLH
jgi:hypothetical protein